MNSGSETHTCAECYVGDWNDVVLCRLHAAAADMRDLITSFACIHFGPQHTHDSKDPSCRARMLLYAVRERHGGQ